MVWLRQWKFCCLLPQVWTKKAFVTLNRVCSYEDFSLRMIVMVSITAVKESSENSTNSFEFGQKSDYLEHI